MLSASKDFKVGIIQINAGCTFKLEKIIDLAKITLNQHIPLGYAKSVDLLNGNILIGLRNGTIIEILEN